MEFVADEYARVKCGLFDKSNKTRFTMSLFFDINTWDVGKTLEKVENHSPINFFSCSPNIPRVYIREQRHGKRVLLLN